MTSIGSYFALAHAGWVLVREGVISALPGDELSGLPRLAHKTAGVLARRRAKNLERSEKLSIAMHRLGPSWVKLGQFLATRPDLVGKPIANDLSLLHDQVEPFAVADAKRHVEASIGQEADAVFSEFGEAIAAASVAQVHRTRLKENDRRLALKVIRPGIRKRFKRDLQTFYAAARLAERYVTDAARLKPVGVVDTLAQSASIEMDLRLEAAAFSEMGENVKDDPGFRVPEVNWQYTGRDCITMDWVDGIKLSNITELKQAGHDTQALAVSLIQNFLRHAVRDGFFHADMHPGNLFVDKDGTIVAVDFGIMGRLGKKERKFLAEILFGFITRDYLRVAQVHFDAGYVPAHHDVRSFAQAIRAIGEPIHGQSAESISMAKLFALLFEVTDLFDMETRTELIMLQKTMVVVEGVARSLDPQFNMWKTAEPVVGDWIAQNLGPAGKVEDARDALNAMARLINLLPEIAHHAETLSLDMEAMIKNGMRFDAESIRAIGKAEARSNLVGHIGIWALVALGCYWLLFT